MKKIFTKIFLSIITFFPLLAIGQSIKPSVAPGNFSEIICIFVKLVLDFIPYVVVLAVGAFLMGLIKYVKNGDNEEKRAEGNKLMIYGILGFFFIVAIWGILKIFVQSFGFTFVGVPQLPTGEAGSASFANRCLWFFTGGN